MQCSNCSEVKQLQDFEVFIMKGRAYTRKQCKPCRRAKVKARYDQSSQVRERHVANAKEWAKNNPDKKKIKDRRAAWKRQGIDPDLAEAYYQDHDGKCEICNHKSNGASLAIDHCHSTGRIRGMLCGPCNRGIGLLQDSPNLLQAAYDYLTK